MRTHPSLAYPERTPERNTMLTLYTLRGAAKFLNRSRANLVQRQADGRFPPPDALAHSVTEVTPLWSKKTLVRYGLETFPDFSGEDA